MSKTCPQEDPCTALHSEGFQFPSQQQGLLNQKKAEKHSASSWEELEWQLYVSLSYILLCPHHSSHQLQASTTAHNHSSSQQQWTPHHGLVSIIKKPQLEPQSIHYDKSTISNALFFPMVSNAKPRRDKEELAIGINSYDQEVRSLVVHHLCGWEDGSLEHYNPVDHFCDNFHPQYFYWYIRPPHTS